MAKKPWHEWPTHLRVGGETREAIYARDGYRCSIALTGCTIRPTTLDHIVRPEDGGAWFDPVNLRAACRGCNSKRRRGVFKGATPQATRPTRLW